MMSFWRPVCIPSDRKAKRGGEAWPVCGPRYSTPQVLTAVPGGVHGSWDGKDVGTLTAQEWVDNTTATLKRWNKRMPEDPRPRSVQPEWLPRGSLGLYLYYGSASFRRIVVEPLRPSN
jgi:hypothetical protein